MNYQKIYDSIIEKAKVSKLICYKEEHHIVPLCLHGSNNKENLVKLTAKEHFVCHRLLCKIYPNNNKLRFALWMMMTCCNKQQQRINVSPRIYKQLKEEMIVAAKQRVITKELREKFRQATIKRIKSGTFAPKLARTNCSLKLKGVPRSVKDKEFISKQRQKQNVNKKKIQQLDFNTFEILNTFNSIQEAGSICNITPDYISDTCKLKRSSFAGYIWKFEEQDFHSWLLNYKNCKTMKTFQKYNLVTA